MKFLRWIVLIKNDPSGFYAPVSDGRFLVGFGDVSDTLYLCPRWASDCPALYSRRGARFIVSELRRVGYNVSSVPYALLMVVAAIKAWKNRKWR